MLPLSSSDEKDLGNSNWKMELVFENSVCNVAMLGGNILSNVSEMKTEAINNVGINSNNNSTRDERNRYNLRGTVPGDFTVKILDNNQLEQKSE